MHVAKNHPWAGIVAPESSNFTLSRQEVSDGIGLGDDNIKASVVSRHGG